MPDNPTFTVSQWKGHDNFECSACAYSTLSERLIEEHVALAHRPTPVERRRQSALLGPDGAPIEVVAVDTPGDDPPDPETDADPGDTPDPESEED